MVNVSYPVSLSCPSNGPSESNAADKVKIEREIEEKDTKQLSWFLPQSGSSLVPLALPRRFHYNPILLTNAQAQK
jgi:hypothetical protein